MLVVSELDGPAPGDGAQGDPLDGFHPAVARWFWRRFPEGPTVAQARGWPSVRAGADTLIAAPTGSGKTLAGFLTAIDAAYRAHGRGEQVGASTRVVYVSPLKALAVDIQQNLQRPLAEIAHTAAELGCSAPAITVAVRTGDTPPAARASMTRRPPAFLMTTPESLYLMLTARRSRATLRAVETVIVDEIHAVARDKRGAHLALTLERLERVQDGARPQRVGLSATQHPIEATARLLAGSGAGREASVVDCGHRRALSVRVELPETELGATPTTEQLVEVVDRIAACVAGRRTTLVFVNTRRMSERLAHMLGERLGADRVAAHHGSLSVERRKRTEDRLRAGELAALVATASLELGIDVGPIELVCQVGSPRSIATFLQRVGRANHSRHGVPEGIVFPMTRDELVECGALLAAVRAGRLDSQPMPRAPLDILAQQIVAEVAAAADGDGDGYPEPALLELVRAAAPYESLARAELEEVLELLAEGMETGRGRRMAYLHRDRVNGLLRPRRGARLAALTSGGAIAETGDYRVVLEPDEVTVGSVNEDFAVESMAGDVFLLGTHAWRVRRVHAGEVRVRDAEGANPTVPFWLGEAPARSDELSEQVSALRLGLDRLLSGGDRAPAVAQVQERCGLQPEAARQLVDYLDCARQQLGGLPSRREVVFERFFDDAGGMQLVVHAPFGARVNRAYGLALRKRFCVTFDFELQAAASDDALVLSLGPQHSFPLQQAPRLVSVAGARSALEQAVLPLPMFATRWRFNLNRALAVLRRRGARKSPIALQRMEAEDLMAAVFPALAACQENAPPGPLQIPEHVLVRQTMTDCLHEAMDVDGLMDMLAGIESGRIATRFVDSTEPSLLAHEILNGRPYTFLDDAPLEERRTRQVQLARGLPLQPQALGQLDSAAVARVRAEAAPAVRGPEELHDLLLSVVVWPSHAGWQRWFQTLVDDGRAMTLSVPHGTGAVGTGAAGAQRASALAQGARLWCAVERRQVAQAMFPAGRFDPDRCLDGSGDDGPEADEAVAQALRGHLELAGPVTAGALAARTGLTGARVNVGLARLEAEGFAIQGSFDAPGQWCARRLLARAHAYTRNRLRAEIEPVGARDFMRFLARWQHVAPGTQRHGRAGLLEVIDCLQGFELAAGAWEESVLRARVEGYQERWLEDLCLSGSVVWGRFALRPADPMGAQPRRGAATPSRATPITFALRDDLPWLLRAARGDAGPQEPVHGAAHELLDALRRHGAMFSSELQALTGRLPVEVDEGLWDLVARGLVSADSFAAVRELFFGREAWRRRRRPGTRRLGARRAPPRHGGEGRWALLGGWHADEAPGGAAGEGFGDGRAARPAGAADRWLQEPEELAEQVAGQLLARWGVLMYDLMVRESVVVPWRELLWALRRMEARGVVRGGRFVAGFAGEQYALPEAVSELRAVRRGSRPAAVARPAPGRAAAEGDAAVSLSAADPLNLLGVVLPGERVPALRTRVLRYRDGVLSSGSPGLDGPSVGGLRAPSATPA